MLFYRWRYRGSKGCVVDNQKRQNSSLVLSALVYDILSSVFYLSNKSGWSLRDPFSLVFHILACMYVSLMVCDGSPSASMSGEVVLYFTPLSMCSKAKSLYTFYKIKMCNRIVRGSICLVLTTLLCFSAVFLTKK